MASWDFPIKSRDKVTDAVGEMESRAMFGIILWVNGYRLTVATVADWLQTGDHWNSAFIEVIGKSCDQNCESLVTGAYDILLAPKLRNQSSNSFTYNSGREETWLNHTV